MREDAEVICPACHERIDLQIDLDAGSRSYVEECAICDTPMRVQIEVSDDGDEFSVDVEELREVEDDADDDGLIEIAEVTCPACWETIEITLDLSAGSQTYSEDCSVCCRPMTVRLWVSDDQTEHTVEVEAESE